jgi:hypothetical protein
MSLFAPKPNQPLPNESLESAPTTDAAKPKHTWWQAIADVYRRRPLLAGVCTLAGLAALAAGLASLISPGQVAVRSNFGQEETPATRLRSIADNLRRMDEFGQVPCAEMLRDSLNPWIRQLRPTGKWLADPSLVTLLTPQVETALQEQKRLRNLIAEKQKELAGKSGPSAVSQEARKELEGLLQQLRSAETALSQLRTFHQNVDQELGNLTFSLEDALIIQGMAWMRDISNRLRENLLKRSEGALDKLALAQELFDWTIRNIALDERERQTTELAWESLLWGRAPSHSRAWIFMELCRQQGLETVMLGYRNSAGSADDVWLPAVLLSPPGSAADAPPELYLFDHKWAIPLPGPGGKGVATLTQAAQSPEVLDQLRGLRRYGVSSTNLGDPVALIDVSPHLLSRRMQLLESELRGADRLVLSGDLSRLMARLGQIKALKRVGAWSWPQDCLMNSRRLPPETLRTRFMPFVLHGVEEKGQRNKKLMDEHMQRFQELAAAEARAEASEPAVSLEAAKRQQRQREVPGFLWRGRMLQFRGAFADADDSQIASSAASAAAPRRGAPSVYQTGRITDRELNDLRKEKETDRETIKKQQDELAKQGAADQAAFLQRVVLTIDQQIEQMPMMRLERQFARLMATQWIGLVAHERGDYKDAAEYFRHVRDVEAPALSKAVAAIPEKPSSDMEKAMRQYADGLVTPMLTILSTAANFNLARSLEAAGKYAEAIDAYENDNSADQRPGSLYRAKRLKEQLATKQAAKKPEAGAGEAKTPGEAKKSGETKKPSEAKTGQGAKKG